MPLADRFLLKLNGTQSPSELLEAQPCWDPDCICTDVRIGRLIDGDMIQTYMCLSIEETPPRVHSGSIIYRLSENLFASGGDEGA